MVFYSLLERAETLVRERKNTSLEKHLQTRFESAPQPTPDFFFQSFLLGWAMGEELRQLPPLEKPPEWMIHPESGNLLSYEPQENGFILSGTPSFPLREVDSPLQIEYQNQP